MSKQGSHQTVTMSPESISKILFPTMTSNIKMRKLKMHNSNHVMPCVVNVFGTYWRLRNEPDKIPGVHCGNEADTVSIISNCEIQWRAMLIV